LPTPPISVADRRKRKAAIEAALKDGFAPYRQQGGKGSAVAEAARALGVKRATLDKFVVNEERHVSRGEPDFLPDWSLFTEPEQTIEPTRVERLDAEFWRRKCKAVEKDLADAEHLLGQFGGFQIPVTIPDWLIDTRQSKRGKSVIGCLLSDIHMGEVITAEEILGINAFNTEICRVRLRRYFTAACTIGQRWASDTDCEGALLALAGDLISGDIHEELRITNELTSHEQVQVVVEECAAGIRHLADTYGRVHVVGVPGNHGRTTHKPTAKLYARLSYDMLAVNILASQFKDDSRVTFQAGSSKDQLTPIFGRTVFTTHGDKIGTRGGMGFAGPMLPIVRGSKKIDAQQAGIGRRPDLIQFGHYHTTGNPGMVLANGSVPGYSEYGDDLRAVVEPPQQWLYLLHSRWWMRERLPVQLEEPRMPEKPRVTVPAGWQAANH
jgi:transposase-like protein